MDASGGELYVKVKYRPDLDGLRAIAVCAVVLYHAFQDRFPTGFIGVDIFFVISGYLVGGIIWREMYEESFSFLAFFKRRVLRLFPALLLFLCFVLVVGSMALFPDEFGSLGRYVFGAAFCVTNFLLWQDSGYFDASSRSKPLLHLWSLGIEEQFYLFIPVILFLCIKLLKKRSRVFVVAVLLCLISFILNILSMRDPTADYYNIMTRAWELLVGVVFAIAKENRNDRSSVDEGIIKTLRGAGLTALGLTLYLCAFVFIKNTSPYPGWQALLPVLGTLACIAAQENIIGKLLLANRFSVYLGRISYPFYLWHWGLLSFGWIIYGSPSRVLRISLVLISFVFAILTFELLEKLIRANRQFSMTYTCLVCGMIMVGVLGMVVFLCDGFPQRGEFSEYSAVLEQLDKSSLSDDVEISYAGFSPESFRRCRYTNVQAPQTVALIGDSHALAAYSGVANLGYELGYNTVVMTRAIPGSSAMKGEAYKDYLEQMETVFAALSKQSDITKVFWCLQGSAQLGVLSNSLLSEEEAESVFLNEMQNYIDLLNKQGKEVYVLSDNPTLPADIRYYIGEKYGDSLLIKRSAVLPDIGSVYLSQKNYLDLIQHLNGATIIDVIGPMSEGGQCRLFTEDGLPMYVDSNHLSVAGSEYQAKYILYPYLKQ